tara:strand:- start:822 stop:1049 length:228 start_codon:yes stop_codon:yes gene_type:complete
VNEEKLQIKNLLKLQEIVESHDDVLRRESAEASLGALGNKDALRSMFIAVEILLQFGVMQFWPYPHLIGRKLKLN